MFGSTKRETFLQFKELCKIPFELTPNISHLKDFFDSDVIFKMNTKIYYVDILLSPKLTSPICLLPKSVLATQKKIC